MPVGNLKILDFEQVTSQIAPNAALANITTATTGNNVIGPLSCVGNKTMQLYTISTTAVTSP